jgi:hypothetical protein
MALNTAEAVVGRSGPSHWRGRCQAAYPAPDGSPGDGGHACQHPSRRAYKVIKRGVTYHHCGGVHYRPYCQGNTVVYVVEEP